MTLLYPETDTPIIRRMIMRRLESEKGVKILATSIRPAKDCIHIGIWWHLDDWLIGDSHTDLQPPYERIQLVNEIDKIAEQLKTVRRLKGQKKQFSQLIGLMEPFRTIGDGLRAHWRKS